MAKWSLLYTTLFHGMLLNWCLQNKPVGFIHEAEGGPASKNIFFGGYLDVHTKLVVSLHCHVMDQPVACAREGKGPQ